MLDYQWNEIIRSNGLTQMTLPVYDKKLWLSDGMFEAPSLRSIASTICDIAGSVTGQSWWLGLVDDAVFATLDLSIEKKDIGEVALGFAKAAAINTMSFGVGAAGKAVTAAASTIANTALRVGAQAAWSMGSSYISSVGAGFINAFDYSDGNVTYNWDKATKSLYSSDTITGALSAGISTGISYSLNFSINNKLRTMDNGAEINKIYGGAINLGVSAASKLGEYSVYAAYALSQGRTLQDAFDDMGGISINVLSLGSIADMLANGVSRTNGTGQSKLVKLADSLRGTGILELNFGSKGISARIGTGGIDVGSNLYDLVKRQSDKNAIQNYAKTAGKDKYETVWNNYIYGDTIQENTSARIADGKDELYITNIAGNGPRGATVSNGNGGRKIFINDYGDKYQNALTLGHESYRDGIKSNEIEQFCETVEAVKAHTEMAQRMLGYNVSPGIQAIQELIETKDLDSNEFMEYVAENYDFSGDYWKVYLNADGSITKIDDGRNDYYLQIDDGTEFKIWDVDGNWSKRFNSFYNNRFNDPEFFEWAKKRTQETSIRRAQSEFDSLTPGEKIQTLNSSLAYDELSFVDKELYKRIGMYEILNSNNLLNEYETENYFNKMANSFVYIEGVGNFIDLKQLKTIIQESVPVDSKYSVGSQEIIKYPNRGFTFSSATFEDVIAGGGSEQAGFHYYTLQEKAFSDDKTKPKYPDAPINPDYPETPVEIQNKKLNNIKFANNMDISNNKVIYKNPIPQYDKDVDKVYAIGSAAIEAGKFIVGAVNKIQTKQNFLSVWPNQIITGNNLFTVQKPTFGYYDFETRTAVYTYDFLSTEDTDFNKILKDAKNEVQKQNKKIMGKLQ